MLDPALPPSDTADQRDQSDRVGLLARRQQMTPVVMPFAVVGGDPKANGFQVISDTTYVDIIRTDSFVTARYLDYDLQTTDTYNTTPPTSVDWRIVAYFPINTGLPTTTLVSGSGTGSPQYAGYIDLFTVVSWQALTEYTSLRLQLKRTGGSGFAAGVRMVKPWMLRSVTT